MIPSIRESELFGPTENALIDYHAGDTVVNARTEVRGGRFVDLLVTDRPPGMLPIAIEVENKPGEYREAVGQAAHYRRAGYVPVVALPVDLDNLHRPDTNTGEALNVCAANETGLVGIALSESNDEVTVDFSGYILRPFDA